MKQCKYCGKELHDNSSFCPYCMKNQIEKQGETVRQKKSNKVFYFKIVLLLLLTVLIVLISIYLLSNKDKSESSLSNEITGTVATELNETIPTTIITTLSNTVYSTTETSVYTTAATETTIQEIFTTEPVTTSNVTTYEPTENTSEVIDYSEYIGVYYPEGLTEGDVKGIYGYEKIGGIELFIDYIDQIIMPDEYYDKHLDISINLFDEYDIIEVRHVKIDVSISQNPVIFDFKDVYDGEGTATLLFENGKIHIKTVANESAKRQTRIVVDEWLS